MKHLRKGVDPKSLKTIWDWCRYAAIRSALIKTGGKLQPAAKLLKVSNFTTRKYARELGLWPWRPIKSNDKAKKIHK